MLLDTYRQLLEQSITVSPGSSWLACDAAVQLAGYYPVTISHQKVQYPRHVIYTVIYQRIFSLKTIINLKCYIVWLILLFIECSGPNFFLNSSKLMTFDKLLYIYMYISYCMKINTKVLYSNLNQNSRKYLVNFNFFNFNYIYIYKLSLQLWYT